MTPAEIHTRLKERFGDHILEFEESLPNPSIKLVAEVAAEVGKYLKDDPGLQFNYLMCLSGVDYGAGQSLGIVYHLQSMTLMHQIVLKVEVPRTSPSVPSVALIWRTADWHEREAYDLFGIRFEGHPDLRRIFLPDDWEGHPLRKDYVVQEFYHDIRVPFPDLDPDRGTYVFGSPGEGEEIVTYALKEYFANVFAGIWTLLVGMRLTFGHLFTPAVTLQYPDEKWELPPGARAQLFNNFDDCIGCGFCAKVCPVDCIYIDTVKTGPGEDLGRTTTGNPKRLHVLRFDIDMAKCCYCNLCTIPCPTECLQMTPKYENSVYNRANLLYHYSTYSAVEAERIRAEAEKRDAEEAEKRRVAAAARAAAKAAPKEAGAKTSAAKAATTGMEPVARPAE